MTVELATVSILLPLKTLKSTLATMAKVAPKRSHKPILQCVKIDVDTDSEESGVWFSATDLETSIRTLIPFTQRDGSGSFVVPIKALSDALKSFGAKDDVRLIFDESTLTIQGLHSESTIILRFPSEDFPVVERWSASSANVVEASSVALAIERTLYATGEDTRYVLSGLCLDFDEKRFVGCDGHRLATQSVDTYIATEEDSDPMSDWSAAYRRAPVLNPLVANILQSITSKGNPSELVRFASKRSEVDAMSDLMVKVGNVEIYQRMTDGRYPLYKDVFPTSHELSIDLESPDLLAISAGASACVTDACKSTDFLFVGNESDGIPPAIVAEFYAGETRIYSRKTLAVGNIKGQSQVITLDPRFVVDIAKSLGKTGQVITVRINGHKSPIEFRTADGLHCVVMPLARDRDKEDKKPTVRALDNYRAGRPLNYTKPKQESAESEATPEPIVKTKRGRKPKVKAEPIAIEPLPEPQREPSGGWKDASEALREIASINACIAEIASEPEPTPQPRFDPLSHFVGFDPLVTSCVIVFHGHTEPLSILFASLNPYEDDTMQDDDCGFTLLDDIPPDDDPDGTPIEPTSKPTPTPKTLTEAIDLACVDAADTIRDYVSLGWLKSHAVEHVRNGSCLGPKSWSSVLEMVADIDPPIPYAHEWINAILAIPIPKEPINPAVRSVSQKERTKIVRVYVRGLGLKGISVTSATGSMCFWTNIALPATSCDHLTGDELAACRECQGRRLAIQHLDNVLACAFPDPDDRSDSHSDHFDYGLRVD